MLPRPYEIRSDDLELVFWGQRWIQNSIEEYRRGNFKLESLKGKKIIFPERHVLAALMHLYVGTFSLSEIADIVSATRTEINFLRTQIDFMIMVDAIKVSFTRYFRNKLILNEYRPIEYSSIAAEYAVFEELVRNQIRLPLFGRMKELASSISDKVEFNLSVDLYDLITYMKLYSFFVFEEYYLPALSRPSFHYMKRVAKEIVWKRLEEDYNKLDSVLSYDLSRRVVKDTLKQLFIS